MFTAAILEARPRPSANAGDTEKRQYATRLSNALAKAMAADLRRRGLSGCFPDPNGGGAERVIAGGIGAKKVDVSWANDVAGLLMALSVKTINFPDGKTKNYQKNVTNRRGDMLFEAVTLHRRFPYAVLGGFLLLHAGAKTDGTDKRDSTFDNVHDLFRLFTGRADPAGREEQYERIYIGLYEDEPASVTLYEAGRPDDPVTWENAAGELLRLVADRNPDHYQFEVVPDQEPIVTAVAAEDTGTYKASGVKKTKAKTKTNADTIPGPRLVLR